MCFEVLGRKLKESALQVVFSFLLSLEVRDFVRERREEVYEGTSGHVDGVRVENCVPWTRAQIHPRTAGPWQEAGCANQNLRTCCRSLANVTRKSSKGNFRGKEEEKVHINL